MKQIIVNIVTNYKSALVILLVALIGLQTLVAFAQATPNENAELESATAAKRVLARIQPRNFARIKDARMRNAVEQSYKALKVVAKNNSKAREAGVMAEFDRTIKDLKSLPQPTNNNFQECDDSYSRCMELCKLTGSDCKLCGLSQNGCYLNRLAIEITKNPLDPTP